MTKQSDVGLARLGLGSALVYLCLLTLMILDYHHKSFLVKLLRYIKVLEITIVNLL